MKVKIKALQNFGLGGKNVAAGTVIDVDTDEFGGTFADYEKGKMLIQVVEGRKDGKTVWVEKGKPVPDGVKLVDKKESAPAAAAGGSSK